MKKLKILFVSLNTKSGFDYIDQILVKELKNKFNIKFCCLLEQYYGKEVFILIVKNIKKINYLQNLKQYGSLIKKSLN